MNSAIKILGIDLGKNWFHVIGIDEIGRPVLRKKCNRVQLQELAVNTPCCNGVLFRLAVLGSPFHRAGS
jgi:hypothetical protein